MASQVRRFVHSGGVVLVSSLRKPNGTLRIHSYFFECQCKFFGSPSPHEFGQRLIQLSLRYRSEFTRREGAINYQGRML